MSMRLDAPSRGEIEVLGPHRDLPCESQPLSESPFQWHCHCKVKLINSQVPQPACY